MLPKQKSATGRLPEGPSVSVRVKSDRRSVAKGSLNKKSRPSGGHHFYYIRTISYLYAANENTEDPDLESGWFSDVVEAFLIDSLVEVIFSD